MLSYLCTQDGVNLKHSRLEYDLHDTWSLKYNFLFRVCYIVQYMQKKTSTELP